MIEEDIVKNIVRQFCRAWFMNEILWILLNFG